MSFPGFYLFLSIVSLILVMTAVVRARRLSFAMPFYFIAAWLAAELAPWHLLLQLLLTLVFALSGGLSSNHGQLGLVLFIVNWIGFVYLIFQSMKTGSIMEAALKRGLGENYRGDIPVQRQSVLKNSIDVTESLRSFSMPRAGVKVHRNLVYGDAGERNMLDVYQPGEPREGGYPVLLQVHGGAWMIGNKQQQALPLMYHLAQRGWLCVACNYRLSPKHTFSAHIIDVKKAIAWVRDNAAEYGGDANFLAITGGSAGGQLSSLAALTGNLPDFQPGFEEVDTRISAAVPIYGVYDFLDRQNIRGSMSMEPILTRYVFQSSLEEGREARDLGSPLSHVSDQAPPMFVVQGSHDSLVWVEEARLFVDTLRRESKEAVVYGELAGAQHAFEVFHSIRTDHTVNAITDFLEWCYASR